MTWRAKVWLQETPNSNPLRDLGEIILDGPSFEHERVTFLFEGQSEVGFIECIDPPDWQKQDTIPTVHISLPKMLK